MATHLEEIENFVTKAQLREAPHEHDEDEPCSAPHFYMFINSDDPGDPTALSEVTFGSHGLPTQTVVEQFVVGIVGMMMNSAPPELPKPIAFQQVIQAFHSSLDAIEPPADVAHGLGDLIEYLRAQMKPEDES